MYEITIEDAMKIMKARNEQETVLPVYVIIGGEKYSLFEIDSIENCSRGIFKVGFVSGSSIFGKNNFPENRLFEFDTQKVFTEYDPDKNVEYKCYVLETGFLMRNDALAKEVNSWIDIIFNHIMENVNKIKKERIKSIMEELS